MKLACESCPFWTREEDHRLTGTCHHAQNLAVAGGGLRFITEGDFWCSLHPAAPQPIYEFMCYDPTRKNVRAEPGFEPVSVSGTDDDWAILARRIVAYTKGGE